MASDFAAPSSHAQPTASSDHMQLDSHARADVLTNGNHDSVAKDSSNSEASNNDAFASNSSLPPMQPVITKEAPLASQPESSAPPAAEDLPTTNPIVADIMAKDPPTNSHPTPPPDPPLVSPPTEMNPDTEMTNGDSDHQSKEATATPVPAESSLIRPREDDDEEERAAKRSKLEAEESSAPVESSAPTLLAAVATPAPVSVTPNPPVTETPTPAVESPAPSAIPPLAEPAVESPAQNAVLPPSEPSVLPVPTEPIQPVSPTPIAQSIAEPTSAESVIAPSEAPVAPTSDVKPETEQTESKPLETIPQAPPVNGETAKTEAAASVPLPPAQTDVRPSVETGAGALTPAATESAKYSTAPITPAQKHYLADKWKNIKKTKHANFFLRPVDFAALNIPNYPEVIKNPMDLSTMEQKLKEDKYASVQDFANDFELIVNNTRTFNGVNHVVTQAGFNMKAYFDKFMEMVPGTDQPLPSASSKKRSPAARPQPRREPRNIPAPAPAPAANTFALHADGTPQIRRDSNVNNRPARAIKPPPNRELTYAKPKRKEHHLELKFCEHILNEIRGPRYHPNNSIFLQAVDPVALNIPHYFQVIKNPMDLGTMTQKLKNGEYGKASEVKKDFDLTIQNCLTFNPVGNPVRDMAIQLQRDFNSLWAEKEKWERANKPETQRDSSDEESAGEEEEEDDHDDEKERTIQALQKQLETMQNMIVGLTSGKSAKSTKKSSKKSGSKKVGSMSAAPAKSKSAPKAKAPKKPRQVTYEEKQEISEAVGRMNEAQVGKLTQIITENCARYRDMEEMELEIDDLPNDVQALLLKYVRSLFGNPNKARAASPDDVAAFDDDDFEPRSRNSGGGAGRRKKHKPMGKHEQGETIKELQSRLAQFNGGTGSSESPTNHQADTSGDEESEESEEE